MRVAFVGFASVLTLFSLMIWRTPFQIIVPEFHDAYLIIGNKGHWSAFAILAWFLLGGVKTSLMLLHNRSQFPVGKILLKAVFFLPFTTLMPFKGSWYSLEGLVKKQK